VRVYASKILEGAEVMTIDEWYAHVVNGAFNECDGSGYWCKDGKESDDSVWSSDLGDATHVAWYNK
jgi:hypothetical protein